MIIEDKFVISAPVQQVWDFFLDVPSVSTCVPGVKKVEQIDDQNFRGSLGVKVGPISANFSGKATLVDLEPPHRLKAKAQGKDKTTASMVNATFTATLTELEPSQTEIDYQIDVAIRGRLGQFGQGVIRETTKQITQVFVECVQERLTAQMAGGTSTSDMNKEGGTTTSTEVTEAQSPAAPSLLSIFFKAIVTSIGNWVRSLWPGSGKPAD